jgi:transcriptional regulator with XRE-family HTH domain
MTDAERVKEIIDEKEIKVSKLARMTGISATTLYSIFQRNGSVSIENAIRIANALGIDPNEICSNSPVKIIASPEQSISPIQKTLDFFEKNDPEMIYNAENILQAYYQMDDEAKEELLSFLEMKLKRHTDPNRLEQVEQTIKGKYRVEEYPECEYCRTPERLNDFAKDIFDEYWNFGIYGDLNVSVSIAPERKELYLAYFITKGGYGDETIITINFCPICGRRLMGRYYRKEDR